MIKVDVIAEDGEGIEVKLTVGGSSSFCIAIGSDAGRCHCGEIQTLCGEASGV